MSAPLSPSEFVLNFTIMEPSQVVSFMKIREKPRFGTFWNLKNEIKPADLFCYLFAKFGQPNGIQNFLRYDSSDNLIHWQWMLMSQNRHIFVQGLNFRSEIWITGEEIDLESRNNIVEAIKKDFQNVGQRMSAIRKSLEHWTEFINPYKRVRNSIEYLISEIDSLQLDFTNDPIPDMVEFRDFKDMEEAWQERSKKYRSALGLSFGVRAMLPVMAESFVNLLLYYLMKPELKADVRLRENIIRQQFDIRVKSLSNNCFGFAKQVDYSNDICGKFHSLVNERNDLLHGNFTIEKLKFNEIYFSGRVPIFKEYSTMWERAFGIEQKLALRQVCSRFRVVTHPAPALGCVCENVQHQGVVPVCRMRRG